MQRFLRMQAYLHILKSRLIQGYNVAFSPKYLLFTNSALLISTIAFGDVIRQRVEIHFDSSQKFDKQSTQNMMKFGCVSAPFQHFWYLALDRFIVKGTVGQIVFKKVIADQAIFSPVFVLAFLGGMGFLEGNSLQDCKKEIKEKALPMYIVDCSIWPAAQVGISHHDKDSPTVINFYFLPSHLRLAYITFITLCYNIFLSYYKHKDTPKI